MADLTDPFEAVADPRRRALLTTLAQSGPATATSLARDLPVTRQAVVKQLALLEDAGLVRRDRDGREVRFAAVPARLHEVAAWVETVSDRWQARLDRMRGFVEAEERRGRTEARGTGEDLRARAAGARLRRVRNGQRPQRVVHEGRRGRR